MDHYGNHRKPSSNGLFGMPSIEGHSRSSERLLDYGDDFMTRPCDDPDEGGSSTHQLDRRKQRNYRLIIDPFLKQGPTKVYRFDGHLPGDPTTIVLRDPRSRMARYGTRRDVNLPVPPFKFDENYVGTVLPKEVTFCNLNNNISDSFLRDMCKNFGGVIEEATVYYHPRTRRHLGIGTVLFSSTRAARLCADKLHLTSKMGNIMTVFVDNLGQQRCKLVEEATAEKSLVRPPSPKSLVQPEPYKQPPVPDVHRPSSLSTDLRRMSDPPRQQALSDIERGPPWLRPPIESSHASVKPFDAQRTVFIDGDSAKTTPALSQPLSQDQGFPQFPSAPHVRGDFSFSTPLPPPPLPRDLGLSFPPTLQLDLTLPPPPLPIERGGYTSSRLLPPPPLPGQGYRAPISCDGPVLFEGTTESKSEDVSRKSFDQQHDQSSSSMAYSIGRACREAAAAASSSSHEVICDDSRRSGNRHNGRSSARDSLSHSSSRHADVPNLDNSRSSSSRDSSSRDSGWNAGHRENNRDDNRREGRGDLRNSSHYDSRSIGRRDDVRSDRRGSNRHEDERSSSRRHDESRSSRRLDPGRDSDGHRRNHRDYKHTRHHQRSDSEDEVRHRDADSNSAATSLVYNDNASCDAMYDMSSESNSYVPGVRDDGGPAQCGIVSAEDSTSTEQPTSLTAPLSLELRIEALLAQSVVVPFLSPTELESSAGLEGSVSSVPPMPVVDGSWKPPSVNDGMPPLSVDNILVQAPPPNAFAVTWDKMPSSHIVGDDLGTPSDRNLVELLPQVYTQMTGGAIQEDDDDRMSLSSLSSGEEKLEVVEGNHSAALNANGILNAQMFVDHAQNYVNNKITNHAQQSLMWPVAQADIAGLAKDNCITPVIEQDKIDASRFESVLDRVISELRVVMCRDMRKKMIESTGFKSFEQWFLEKTARSKPSVSRDRPSARLIEEGKRPGSIASMSNTLTPVTSAPLAPPSSTKPAVLPDISAMSLVSLFDRNDNGSIGLGFGSGGLLGLRGVMPKMPSFKKKCPSPVRPTGLADDVEQEDEEQEPGSEQEDHDAEAEQDPDASDDDDDEDDDEDDVDKNGGEDEEDDIGFRGPRTPQDSFDDDDKAGVDESSAESDSIESEDDEIIPQIRPSKKVIYSSESENDSAKSDFEDETQQDNDKTRNQLESQDVKSRGDDDEDETTGIGDITRVQSETDDDDESTGEPDLSRDEEEDESVGEVEMAKEDSEEEEEADVDVEESEKMSVSSDHEKPKDVSLEKEEEDTQELSKHAKRSEVLEPLNRIKDDHKLPIAVSQQAEEEEGECSDDDDRATVTASEEEEDVADKLLEINHPQAVSASGVPSKKDSSGGAVGDDIMASSDLNSIFARRASKELNKSRLLDNEDKDSSPNYNKSPTVRLERLVIPPSSSISADSFSSDLRHKQSPTDLEHNYFALPQATKRSLSDSIRDSVSEYPVIEFESNPVSTPLNLIALDHCYCKPYVTNVMTEEKEKQDVVKLSPEKADVTIKNRKPSTSPRKKRGGLSDLTNVSISRELSSILTPVVPPPRARFERRDYNAEFVTLFKFLITGADSEDITFLRRRYEQLLQLDSAETDWLNEIHWVDHPVTYLNDPSLAPPPKKRRKHDEVTQHLTGSARTEGYYKISHQEKCNYLSHTRGIQSSDQAGTHSGAGEQLTETDAANQTKKKVQQSREARSESRRWQSVLSSLGEDYGDLLKFNQLKFRKKQLQFARSGIHDWGLFALEQIAEGEMVIEYVGQVVRQSVADLREKRYEAVGIGSSYLFRVDGEAIVDATRYGNLARFINHSCNPNCCAKIVSVESQKKIVIYSRREINVNEEITYDYKFPIEENKIPCFCGAPGCRGSLN